MGTETFLTSHPPGSWRRCSYPNPSPTLLWNCMFASMITATSPVIQYSRCDLKCTEENADETIFICSPPSLAAHPPLPVATSLGPKFVSHKTEASSSEATDYVHCQCQVQTPLHCNPVVRASRSGQGKVFLESSRALLFLPKGRVCTCRYTAWAMAGGYAALGSQVGEGLP